MKWKEFLLDRRVIILAIILYVTTLGSFLLQIGGIISCNSMLGAVRNPSPLCELNTLSIITFPIAIFLFLMAGFIPSIQGNIALVYQMTIVFGFVEMYLISLAAISIFDKLRHKSSRN